MITVQQQLLTNDRTRPFLRSADAYAIRQLKGIVVHGPAKIGIQEDLEARRQFYNRIDRYSSAHYLVDDQRVIQIIPDNEIAFHLGGSRYKAAGERLREGNQNLNYFLLGIEVCQTSEMLPRQTVRNLSLLCAHLLHKYQLSIQDLYRLSDLSGKDGPEWMADSVHWANFRRDVLQSTVALPIPSRTRTIPAQVNHPLGARVYQGPGEGYATLDYLANGAMIYVENIPGKWYQMGPQQWVYAEHLNFIAYQQAVVAGTPMLNVRSGPGTEFPLVRKSAAGSIEQIIGSEDGWSRVGNHEWVYGSFLKAVTMPSENA